MSKTVIEYSQEIFNLLASACEELTEFEVIWLHLRLEQSCQRVMRNCRQSDPELLEALRDAAARNAEEAFAGI